MGKEIARLEAFADCEASAERPTVDRAKPQLEQTVTTTEQSMEFLTEHPRWTSTLRFRQTYRRPARADRNVVEDLHDSAKPANLRIREQHLSKNPSGIDHTELTE